MQEQHKRFIGIGNSLIGLKNDNSLSIICNNKKYFSGIKIKNSYFKNFHLDLNSQIYTISNLNPTHKVKKLDSMSKMFYIRAFSWIIKVIKFTGKGYRLRKLKYSKVLEMNFNNSHITRGLAGGCVFKRITKTEIGIINNNKIKSKKYLKLLLTVRRLNPFTKRGLRGHRQFILKRPGKKNTN